MSRGFRHSLSTGNLLIHSIDCLYSPCQPCCGQKEWRERIEPQQAQGRELGR